MAQENASVPPSSAVQLGMIQSFSGEYRFLSNFWPCTIEYEGSTYPSVEHAYQAAKTLDLEARKRIAALASAGQAKRAGRRLTIRADWDGVKVAVMAELLLLKFEHSDLAHALRCTAPHQIVEGNTWGDTFWGVCDGRGENYLGRLLMWVRDK